jgi:S1-C subfamily serine protease
MTRLRFLLYGLAFGLLIPLTFAKEVVPMNKLEMLHSVAYVLIQNEDESKNGYGSGVVVFADEEAGYSLILTAAHVVGQDGIKDIFVDLYPSGFSIPATVTKVGIFHDLAILRVNVAHPHVAPIAQANPTIFDPVAKVGAGGFMRPYVTTGEVIAVDKDYFWVNSLAARGDSGGGIFTQDADGNYVLSGILVAVAVDGSGHAINHVVLVHSFQAIESFFKQ